MTIPYPDYTPLGPPDWGKSTNTTTLNLPPKRVAKGAKIFLDVKKANRFMKNHLITEVIVQEYETRNYEGLVITVYYEVEEV